MNNDDTKFTFGEYTHGPHNSSYIMVWLTALFDTYTAY